MLLGASLIGCSTFARVQGGPGTARVASSWGSAATVSYAAAFATSDGSAARHGLDFGVRGTVTERSGRGSATVGYWRGRWLGPVLLDLSARGGAGIEGYRRDPYPEAVAELGASAGVVVREREYQRESEPIVMLAGARGVRYVEGHRARLMLTAGLVGEIAAPLVRAPVPAAYLLVGVAWADEIVGTRSPDPPQPIRP